MSRSFSRRGLAWAGLQMRGVEILHARPRPRPPCRRAPPRSRRRCSIADTARGGDLGDGRGWAGRGPRLRWCRGRAGDPTDRESTARASRRRGARPGPVVLDAGRPPYRVTEKSAIGVAGKRRGEGINRLARRWSCEAGVGGDGRERWVAATGGWEERGEMREPESLREINSSPVIWVLTKLRAWLISSGIKQTLRNSNEFTRAPRANTTCHVCMLVAPYLFEVIRRAIVVLQWKTKKNLVVTVFVWHRCERSSKVYR
jgi:hypothetical protein